jgi:hypothetical protein
MVFIKEFIDFLMSRKKFWLIPVLVIIALFGGLVILSQGSVAAPFIYTLF